MTHLLRAPGAPSKWLTLAAACFGLAMLMIDSFVVNVAFPAIGRDLKADLSTAEWTVSGYVLVLAILPIAMGRLGDIFGRRKVYLVGLVLFVVASIGCGAAQDITALVAFRVVQGIGAAIMMPGTLSIITQAFPPQQRGLAIGIWSGVSGLGLITGPILGGLLVQGDNWRLNFVINVPLLPSTSRWQVRTRPTPWWDRSSWTASYTSRWWVQSSPPWRCSRPFSFGRACRRVDRFLLLLR